MKEFLDMGGYAVFVWSSYGIVFAVLVLNIFAAILRKKQIVREIEERQDEMEQDELELNEMEINQTDQAKELSK